MKNLESKADKVTAATAFKDLFRKCKFKSPIEARITLTSLDCLIAATAMAKGHKILTRNVVHYTQEGLLASVEA